MKEAITEFFSWYELHDTPIKGLTFDFMSQTLCLVMPEYDDLAQTEVELRLVFKGLNKYVFDYPSEDFVFDMLAIYQATLTPSAENTYELLLLIDMPENKMTDGTYRQFTVGKMLIGFADLEVIGGLCREAMEYKWKVEEE